MISRQLLVNMKRMLFILHSSARKCSSKLFNFQALQQLQDNQTRRMGPEDHTTQRPNLGYASMILISIAMQKNKPATLDEILLWEIL